MRRTLDGLSEHSLQQLRRLKQTYTSFDTHPPLSIVMFKIGWRPATIYDDQAVDKLSY